MEIVKNNIGVIVFYLVVFVVGMVLVTNVGDANKYEAKENSQLVYKNE